MHHHVIQVIFLTFISFSYSPACKSFISEVHANPKSQSDSEAEFFEVFVYHLTSPCEIQIIVNSDTLDPLEIKSPGFYVFSHDSSGNDEFFTKSLPNSTAIDFKITQKTEITWQVLDSLQVPPSIDGHSWERVVDTDTIPTISWKSHSLQDTLESSKSYGSPNIQSFIFDCYWENETANCNYPKPFSIIQYQSDSLMIWNEISSLSVEKSWSTPKTISTYFNYFFQILGDDYPFNNEKYLLNLELPFQIIQMQIHSNDSTPEWIEVKSQGTSLLDSINIQKDDKTYPLQTHSNSCIFTSDSLQFIALFGPLRTCIKELRPWPTLSNSGGKLCLSWHKLSHPSNCVEWNSTQIHWPNDQIRIGSQNEPRPIQPIIQFSQNFLNKGETLQLNINADIKASLQADLQAEFLQWEILDSQGFVQHKARSHLLQFSEIINQKLSDLPTGIYIISLKVLDQQIQFLFHIRK